MAMTPTGVVGGTAWVEGQRDGKLYAGISCVYDTVYIM